MRILVTGRDGQVAMSLREIGPSRGHEIIALGRPELDLAGDPAAIVNSIVEQEPNAIVSAAAYTAVDKAESDRAAAQIVNVRGANAVAAAARRIDVPLLHLSTDYVFDGSKATPYVETDPTCPGSVYGETKRDGEDAVLAVHDNVATIRTAWVYSPFGHNFVKTMLRLAEDRDEVAVVSDQVGNPTSAIDIAEGLLTIAANLAAASDPALRGVFHMAGTGSASWATFAAAIFEASAELGGPTASVRQITTSEYPTAARRPANSQLDCSKLAKAHGVILPAWTESMELIVERLVGHSGEQRGTASI